MVLLEEPGPALGAVHSQVEEARALAEAGRYSEARLRFDSVLAHVRKATAGMEDTVLRGRWQECARRLGEELALVVACEEESSALGRAARSCGSRRETTVAPAVTAPAPQRGGLAFDIDLQTNRLTAREPPAPLQRGASGPDEADPLKWRPASPLPRSLTTPNSPAHRARRGSESRAAADSAPRHGRHNSYPAQGKGVPGAGATPKVNCWRTPPAGRRPADPRATILDQVISRFGTAEQELVEQLGRDLMDAAPGVRWVDIAGLKAAKQVLTEHVSMPLSMPDLFKGQLLRPCKGVLLFGPPGTGKTMLAKAVATECRTTFFNVSTSTLASKFRGESEKLVRLLFEMARAAAPSVIFMDEIDSVCSSRGAQSEHEASRRLKTELLTQVDGMHTATNGGEPARVMVLAATNFPWDIDEALRRRLEKRIYIPLPSAAERVELLQLCLKDARVAGDVSLEEIAARTEGFSGDDISNMCRDAAFNVVRRGLAGRSMSSPEKVAQMQAELVGNLVVAAVDFEHALQRIHPSCSKEDIARHESFANTFGAV